MEVPKPPKVQAPKVQAPKLPPAPKVQAPKAPKLAAPKFEGPKLPPGPQDPASLGLPQGHPMARMMIGFIIGLLGLFLGILGAIALIAFTTQRDKDGYFHTGYDLVRTDGYAIRSDNIDFNQNPEQPPFIRILGRYGTLRLKVDAVNKSKNLFLGVAPQGTVDRYLKNVAQTQLNTLGFGNKDAHTQGTPGTRAPALPKNQSIWLSQKSGMGIDTTVTPNKYNQYSNLVIMNENGDKRVAARISVGVKADWLIWVDLGLIAAGILFFVIGSALTVSAVQRRRYERFR